MLLHEIPEFANYPLVHSFLKRHVSMQLGDVREMLRLPLPDLGMTHACNFAAAGTLCGFISGVSVSVYQPQAPIRKGKPRNGKVRMEWMRTGSAFKSLLKEYYPWSTDEDRTRLSDALYDQFRNPLAHALGVQSSNCRIAIQRLPSADPNQKTGLTEAQIQAIENLSDRPVWLPRGLRRSETGWELIIEGFYRDVLAMMQRLARDADKMRGAEQRFTHGNVVWNRTRPDSKP